MNPDNVASLIGMGVLAIIQWTFKNRQEEDKKERERVEREIEAIKKSQSEAIAAIRKEIADAKDALDVKQEATASKLSVYREEQIKHQTKLEGIDEKLDRALALLERLSGIEPQADRRKTRP